MRTTTIFSGAGLATLSLVLSGCSANEAPVSADAVHQENELASISSVVTQQNQELSLGFPLDGGQYSLALQCSGKHSASTITWSSSHGSDQGTVDLTCAPEARVVHQEMTLNGYSASLSFIAHDLQGQTLHVSVAAVADA
ncbi:hypothetical protein [Glutamicibacter sp.]|uniref:hypothetical protein n=1 Tax=Glutamicibacter sp. TaxID=1931995 RepID=UPI002FE2AB5F